MAKNSTNLQNEAGDMIARIDDLDKRLSRIEEVLDYKLGSNLRELNGTSTKGDSSEPKQRAGGEAIESQFGEQLFAWISGIMVLFLVVFIMSFIHNQGKAGLAIIVGYGVTGGVLLFSHLMKNSFPRQVYLLKITSHLLLYYVTLRLHFFAENPLLENHALGLAILALPIGYLMYFAFKQKSEILTILGVTMVLATAIVSDHTHVMLSLLSLIAVFGLYTYHEKGWGKLLHFSLFTIYLTHMLWLMNNPFMGHPLQAIDQAQGNLIFLFSYGFIFSMLAIQQPKTGFRQSVVTSITLWSGTLFALILLFELSVFYKENYVGIFAAITMFSLAYSVVLKLRDSHFFITAFYACVSFVALSVMVYGLTRLPAAYLWLGIQSLLVVSIALWFRSPLIVIANTLLFVGLFIFYLIQGEPTNSTNLAFALVAGISARFINWKQERLKLKTEAIRNIYLVATFFTVLFAIYHLVPLKFITISWVGVAGLFFTLSFLLKNKKYRWMAFTTLITAVFYLFFFDLKSMELGYRVIAFLIIAVITLAASFYYSRRSRN